MPDAADDASGPIRPRPFWSGTIAFGLVSLPVNLYAAVRSRRASLRMVDRDGTPLSRRYFCSAEDVPVTMDEIVRGYETEPGEFVVMEDRELEELAPDKTREIDLRRFVPAEDLGAGRFDRAYVLAPDSASTKAYRLLARAMERSGRAGIATFVMRGKEYLVAILAHHGLLLAETLRFEEELRSPEDVGLPTHLPTEEDRVQELLGALQGLARDTLDPGELEDRGSARLRALAQAKAEADEDVLHRADVPSGTGEDDEDDAPIDLMQLLKASLTEGEEPPAAARDGRSGKGRSAEGRGGKGRGGKGRSGDGRTSDRQPRAGADGGDLEAHTKAELYQRAKERDIPGRSSMTKEQLIDAIRG